MITMNSAFSDFVTLVNSESRPSEYPWVDFLLTYAGADTLQTSLDKASFSQGNIYSLLMIWGGEFDTDVIDYFVNAVSDAEIAFQLYTTGTHLTEDNKATLQGVYQGNLDANPVSTITLGKDGKLIITPILYANDQNIIRYVKAVNTGEGFITHDDQEQNGMSFEDFGYDLWKVSGTQTNIDNWIARNNGTLLEA